MVAIEEEAISLPCTACVCVCMGKCRGRTSDNKEGGEVTKPKYLIPSHLCSNRSARFDQRVELVHVRLHVFVVAHVDQHFGIAGEHGWKEE